MRPLKELLGQIIAIAIFSAIAYAAITTCYEYIEWFNRGYLLRSNLLYTSMRDAIIFIIPTNLALKICYHAYILRDKESRLENKEFLFTFVPLAILIALNAGLGVSLPKFAVIALASLPTVLTLTLGLRSLVFLNLIPKLYAFAKGKNALSEAKKALLEKCSNKSHKKEITALEKGVALESLAADVYRKLGCKVYTQGDLKSILPKSGDQGLDLVVESNGKHWIVQCKNYDKTLIKNKEIQELIGAMTYYKRHFNIAGGIFITMSDYKQSAIDLAATAEIQLLNGDDFAQMVKNYRAG